MPFSRYDQLAEGLRPAVLGRRLAGVVADGVLARDASGAVVFASDRLAELAGGEVRLDRDPGGGGWALRRAGRPPLPVQVHALELPEGRVEVVRPAGGADEAAVRGLVDAAPVGIGLWDEDLRFVLLNQAMADINGLPAEAHLGRALPELLPGLGEEVGGIFRRVLETGEALVNVEVRGHTGAGNGERHWLASFFPVRGGGGRVLGVGSVVTDVTDRRRAEEELAEREERFRSVVETSVNAIVTIDGDGRVETFNPGAERMFGYAAREVVGRNVSMLMPDPDRSAHDRYLRRYEATGEATIIGRGREVEGLHRDGTRFWVHLAVGEMRVGGERRYTGVLTDISAEVAAREELRRHGLEQAALRRVATAVARSDPGGRRVYDLVAEEAARTLRAEVGLVVELADGGWRAFGGCGVPPAFGAERAPLRDSGPIARLLRDERAVLAAPPGPGAIGEALEAALGAGLRAVAAAPVWVSRRLWGALVVASARPLAPGSEDRLAHFAELVATAIANAESQRLLALRATHDALTGLPNQAAFHERLEAEVELARGEGRALSLAVLDIDRFKRVNDTLGHGEGDRVLAEVAGRLRETVREGEFLARIGGEEFGWIMHGDDTEAARAAERARHAVGARPVAGAGLLTVSAGVCEVARAGGAGELFRLADVALYQAKAEGRNAVVRYRPDEVEVLSAADRARRERHAQRVGSIMVLARAIDARDPSTQAHSMRVAALASQLATQMGWPQDEVALLHEAGLVHDVGKIGVPDSVLFKPGRLSDEEFAQVRQHPELGATIVSAVLTPEQAGWVRGHHERFDGDGYPDGLRRFAIPEGARVLALADAWDAMVAVRVYKEPRRPEDAMQEVRRQRHRQFCPRAVDAIEALWSRGGVR